MELSVSLKEEFKKSWLTCLIGTLLFCAGLWLLTWNEGKAVHHAHSLEEAYNNVIALNPYEPVRPEIEGRLIHVSGNLLIEEPLTELEYGISIQAVKVKRRVQMYQWVEERTQRDFGDTVASHSSETDYFYVTEWRDKLVDSRNFYIRHSHHNPTEMPLKTHTYVSQYVQIGQLVVGSDLKSKFDDFVEVTSDERPERRDIKLHLGIYYHCDDVWNPEVGDIRVQFYYAGLNGEPVTVVAMQKDGVLVPYSTSKGHEILLLRHGLLSVAQMFTAEHSDARWETWKLRAAGLFILYASTVCLSKLLRIVFLKLPVMKRIVVNEITTSVNLAVSMSVSLLIISIAWILYRPMIGVGLVMASVSPLIYCSMAFYNGGHHQNGHYERQF